MDAADRLEKIRFHYESQIARIFQIHNLTWAAEIAIETRVPVWALNARQTAGGKFPDINSDNPLARIAWRCDSGFALIRALSDMRWPARYDW
jgi:hypothetical protein